MPPGALRLPRRGCPARGWQADLLLKRPNASRLKTGAVVSQKSHGWAEDRGVPGGEASGVPSPTPSSCCLTPPQPLELGLPLSSQVLTSPHAGAVVCGKETNLTLFRVPGSQPPPHSLGWSALVVLSHLLGYPPPIPPPTSSPSRSQDL